MTSKTTSPVVAEATGQSISFDFEGTEYTIPNAEDWPFEVIEAFEAGAAAAILRGLLGPAQYGAFKATKPTVSTATRLVVALQKAVGVEGN
jgi:hypothetical protein